MINTHEKIRPYLREYPLPSIRAEVSLSFHAKNSEYFEHGEVDFIFVAKGNVHYEKLDKTTNKFVSVLVEPYEEA